MKYRHRKIAYYLMLYFHLTFSSFEMLNLTFIAESGAIMLKTTSQKAVTIHKKYTIVILWLKPRIISITAKYCTTTLRGNAEDFFKRIQ